MSLMFRSLLGLALVAGAITSEARAALIVNSARTITDRINVQVIAVADNDGTDSTAGLLGTSTRRAQIFSLVDVVFAQAGVDVNFTMLAGTYNSSFARTGQPGGNNPRPNTDLRDLYQAAAAAGGILSSDTNTINVFLVSIVPGFSQLGANASAGIATIGGNGAAFFGGATLATTNAGGEVLASVLAHEIGHNLGLGHNTVAENLMQSGGGGAKGQRLTAAQISTILSSRFTVPLPQPKPGDFNGNGVVDGRDFLVWQRGGSPSPLSAGDLAVWKANFGGGGNGVGALAAASGTVPEPGGSALGLLSALGVGFQRTRRAVRTVGGSRRAGACRIGLVA